MDQVDPLGRTSEAFNTSILTLQLIMKRTRKSNEIMLAVRARLPANKSYITASYGFAIILIGAGLED